MAAILLQTARDDTGKLCDLDASELSTKFGTCNAQGECEDPKAPKVTTGNPREKECALNGVPAPGAKGERVLSLCEFRVEVTNLEIQQAAFRFRDESLTQAEVEGWLATNLAYEPGRAEDQPETKLRQAG